MSSHSISYTTYQKSDFVKMANEIPPEKLTQFLQNKAVSGLREDFTLEDLILIDSAVFLLCWLSKSGSKVKELIGMRIVGFSEPLKAALLNLTVIFQDHHGQRNLDPMNKVPSYFF